MAKPSLKSKSPSKPTPTKTKRTPVQVGRLSKRKGSKWERDLAHFFAKLLDLDVKRGLGQARAAGEVPDVNGVPGLWVEAKVGKQTNPRAALAQATKAHNDPKAPVGAADRMPIAICKDDGEAPFVMMHLDDFGLLFVEWWTRTRRTFQEEAGNVTSHRSTSASTGLAAARKVATARPAVPASDDEPGDPGEDADGPPDAA